MKVVPDSNLIVALVLTLPYTSASRRKMQQWQEQNVELVVPALWSYEVVWTIRKAIVLRGLSTEKALAALQYILSLRIQEVPPTPALHQLALEWAVRLNQIVAYDAAYLALAESVGAEFWTADQRLADAAINSGASWVHYIEET
jgi:predicted nucleic acid-binding protein